MNIEGETGEKFFVMSFFNYTFESAMPMSWLFSSCSKSQDFPHELL